LKELNLSEITSTTEVYEAARKTGFVKRAGGKINPFDFLMTLVFRLATPIPPALRLISSLLEIPVSRSGLHQKFNAKATEFFKCCLQMIMVKAIMTAQPIKTELLHQFKRVLIIDSSSWDINSQLKAIFSGSGGSASEANCKLQFCYDYKSGSIILLEDMKGTIPDQKYSQNLPIVVKEGDLVLMDLGYWSFETFYKIDSKGGYFVVRLNTQVTIWQLIDGEYKKLNLVDTFKKQKGNSIEIEGFLRGNSGNLKVRFVAFRVPEKIAQVRRGRLIAQAKKKGRKPPTYKSLLLCSWSIFLTNASEELIPGEMIRSIYRIRWCVELIFKSWKSILRMHLSNVRKNHHRLKCELYAKLIFAVIVNSIYQHLQVHVWNNERKEISFFSLWIFIVSHAQSLQEAIRKTIRRFSDKINSLFDIMIKNCEKYHQPSRKTTLQMIDETIGDPIPEKLTIEELVIENL
jgi:hypothetical protein